MPVNVTSIPNVPLLHTGEHEASTGPWRVGPEDLRSMVEAHAAGIATPILKLGHEGPMRDAAPALGTVTALRITNGGTTLVGTLAGVPRAVAGILVRAYPQRSVECWLDHVDRTGRTWPCVLVAVALLGATHPAVTELQSLDDVCRLYGLEVAASGRRVVVAASAPGTPAADRARAVAVARARRTRGFRTVSHERTPA
ncbi:hypothetical protein GBO17_06880 [Mycobacterium avium subsp. hominissuis]|uniref:hypothetical protein n=1 Tax=Mycobacterium avium TaxID=1764 RepID=UPI001CC691EB|nr:hypothetical protein [Mycobacterium avium]MBZ4558673.1 hypothetical protein [Mycobacterium avium subsp. hominissuis]MBZ4568206.1 hypothetical protein [Mycobacterium avium subsp. hominissuis]MBZ4586837.1 hypothetical protein [Mycobacterium avium subsp. hominissuis]MBZ4625154.1 hypothetical protein [Mycobacterium avium subsp. hominissuis]